MADVFLELKGVMHKLVRLAESWLGAGFFGNGACHVRVMSFNFGDH